MAVYFSRVWRIYQRWGGVFLMQTHVIVTLVIAALSALLG
jgi:hypothetical protein